MQTDHTQNHSAAYKWFLTLSALGVVYGDIGTSPLYSLKEAFHHGHLQVNEANIYGLLSLIFWALVVVISVKYILFVLRANYHGEGGILALASLIKDKDTLKLPTKLKGLLVLLGIFGAAFLYGDGIITPAISILSAVEGLGVITPVFDPYIIPITIGILVLLFSIQSRGTGTVGKFFGPVILLWFVVIGALGVHQITGHIEILRSINPYYGFQFFVDHGFIGFTILGSVFLVVTGGEALYSDMGHFGITPIKRAWFLVVLPCLILNYWGQGASVLQNPESIDNPFYMMAPSWFMYPLVALATVATTIASQALITGVFSITMQAVQQGYLPRVLIEHTSKTEHGQIYIKSINYLLMIGCILLVLVFKTSSNLAAAYGLAVTATMIITTILFYFVAVYRWKWNAISSFALCLIFGIVDVAFLGANLLKIFDGGWFPLTLGMVGFVYMTTWNSGRRILYQKLNAQNRNLIDFLEEVDRSRHRTIPHLGIYMAKNSDITPFALLKTYEHFKAIHKKLVFLHVNTVLKPYVKVSHRFNFVEISPSVYKVTLNYGFMEKPNVPYALAAANDRTPDIDFNDASYFIGRENIFATEIPGMALWRERLFAFQTRNETPASEYFKLPKDRVLEIGTQVAI